MSLSSLGPLHEFFSSTWHVWFAIWNLTMAPWLFHPQTFKSGMIKFGMAEWVCWLDSIPRGDDERTAKEKVNARRGLGNKPTWWTWRADTMWLEKTSNVCKVLARVFETRSWTYNCFLSCGCSAERRRCLVYHCAASNYYLDFWCCRWIISDGVFCLIAAVLVATQISVSREAFAGKGTLSEVTEAIHCLDLRLLFKIVCVVLHHFLCQRLFSAQMNQWDFLNAVVFAISGYVFISCTSTVFGLISDQPPRGVPRAHVVL